MSQARTRHCKAVATKSKSAVFVPENALHFMIRSSRLACAVSSLALAAAKLKASGQSCVYTTGWPAWVMRCRVR